MANLILAPVGNGKGLKNSEKLPAPMTSPRQAMAGLEN